MGKYIGYLLLIMVILFTLEWFQIVDIPYFEIPDYMGGKKVIIDSTEKALDQVKWKQYYKPWPEKTTTVSPEKLIDN